MSPELNHPEIMVAGSMTLVVGLTGGIGSGKTQVSDQLANKGITIVDADVVAREVVEPGMPALAAIADYFGSQVLDDQGQLRRDQLRQIIFADENAKAWLEGLLHPLIRQSILQQLHGAQGPYVVLVSPLLLETNQREIANLIVVVDAEPEQQVSRASQRDNNSSSQIEAIMAKQMDRRQRQQQGDIMLDNSGDLSYLQQQVDQLHLQLLDRAKQHA